MHGTERDNVAGFVMMAIGLAVSAVVGMTILWWPLIVGAVLLGRMGRGRRAFQPHPR